MQGEGKAVNASITTGASRHRTLYADHLLLGNLGSLSPHAGILSTSETPPCSPSSLSSFPLMPARPDIACSLPRHFLIAVEVLEAAVQDSAELLDCMLFPTGLEEEQLEGEGEGVCERVSVCVCV